MEWVSKTIWNKFVNEFSFARKKKYRKKKSNYSILFTFLCQLFCFFANDEIHWRLCAHTFHTRFDRSLFQSASVVTYNLLDFYRWVFWIFLTFPCETLFVFSVEICTFYKRFVFLIQRLTHKWRMRKQYLCSILNRLEIVYNHQEH